MSGRRSLWPAVIFVAVVLSACGGAASSPPAARPSAAPTPDGGCPTSHPAESLPSSYRPMRGAVEGDLRGDSTRSRATIVGDEERPLTCRYFVRVEDAGGSGSHTAIEGAASLPQDVPSLLMAAEIDGEPGLEVIVDFGGPMHPHRTGQILTFEEDSLTAMRTARHRVGGGGATLFPLAGEFASGIDCASEPGTVVVTSGDLAAGGTDDRRYEITRVVYEARGQEFAEIRRETHTIEVGAERERWPELADDPFRSCPGGR